MHDTGTFKAMTDEASFFIGDWRIFPHLNRIALGERVVHLEPRVMEVLLVLCENAGRVVSLDAILDNVWSDTIVNPKAVSQAVSELRKAFGDSRNNPRYIETIQKRGYRLIAPLTPDEISTSDHSSSGREKKVLSTSLYVVVAALLGIFVVAWWFIRPASPENISSSMSPLTTLQGSETHPALSPEGSRVAFSWQKEGASASHIYVKHIGQEAQLQLSDGPFFDTSPAWSPDGHLMAFARHADGTRTLYLVPAIGGPLRKIYACNASVSSSLSWSADGQWLAFADRSANGALAIYALSMQTLDVVQLTDPASSYLGDLDPAFSPFEQKLAFIRAYVEGNHDIAVSSFSMRGSSLELADTTLITRDGGLKLGLTWTDKELIYASDRGPFGGLWKVSHSGKEIDRISVPGKMLLYPSMAQNRLAYAEVKPEISVWRRSMTAEADDEPTRIAGSTRFDHQPAVSPDGRQIAFVSTRSGFPEIWTTGADGEEPIQRTRFEGAGISSPLWMPDGEALIFDVFERNQYDVNFIQMESVEPVKLTSDPTDERVSGVSRDGRFVYVSSNRTGQWNAWRYAIDGGSERQMTWDGGFVIQESFNGEGLYYTKAGEAGLWYSDFESREERRVHAGPAVQDWGNWQLTDDGFYYLERAGEVYPSVMFYSFSARTAQSIASLASPIVSNQRAFSIDSKGASLYYTRIDRMEADLMLVNAFR